MSKTPQKQVVSDVDNTSESPLLTQVEKVIKSVGALSTETDIAAACEYLDASSTESELRSADELLARHLKATRGAEENNDGTVRKRNKENEDDEIADRLCLEMSLCRKTKHVSAYFVGGQKLNLLQIQELDCAVEYWINLTLDDNLGDLVEGNVKVVKDSGGSCAAVFRAFMNAYKEKKGFKLWTLALIVGVRHLVFLQVPRIEPKLIQASPEYPPGTKRRKLNNTTGIAAINSNGDIEASSASSSSSSGQASLSLDASTSQPSPTSLSSSASQSIDEESPQDELIKSRLFMPDAIIVSASKITTAHLAAHANHLSKKAACDAATSLTLRAQLDFSQGTEKKIDAAITFFQDCKNSSANNSYWSLSRAKKFLDGIEKLGGELKTFFEAYMEPLDVEANASEELSVALLELQKWERKKETLDKALQAIQALKDL